VIFSLIFLAVAPKFVSLPQLIRAAIFFVSAFRSLNARPNKTRIKQDSEIAPSINPFDDQIKKIFIERALRM
jgi:hypothetical protein